MKSYQLTGFDRPLECVEEAAPEPKGSEVVIEVRQCGVCHTDLHLCRGYYDAGGDKKLTLADRGIQPPIVLGHEILGRLVAAGPHAPVDPTQIGRDFLVYPWIGCGTCAICHSGQENLCPDVAAIGIQRPGGYQEQLIVPHPRYLFDVEGINPVVAATYACSGLTAYAAIRKCVGDPATEALMIIGFGGLGQSALLIAKALGYAHIMAADTLEERRAVALEMGASAVFHPANPDAGHDPASPSRPIAAVLDFVGSEESASSAIAMLRRGGTYVAVGLFGGEIKVSLVGLIVKALSIVGSYVGSPQELSELLALARGRGLRALPVETMPMSDVNQALQKLAKGESRGRIVLTTATSQ